MLHSYPLNLYSNFELTSRIDALIHDKNYHIEKGVDSSPKSTAARLVTTTWWFFALITTSTYTANLAAFLTTKRLLTPIENAQDLSEQSFIKYGCLDGGATQHFFEVFFKINLLNGLFDVFVLSLQTACSFSLLVFCLWLLWLRAFLIVFFYVIQQKQNRYRSL